jgi:hypothetical protein
VVGGVCGGVQGDDVMMGVWVEEEEMRIMLQARGCSRGGEAGRRHLCRCVCRVTRESEDGEIKGAVIWHKGQQNLRPTEY